MSLGNLHVASKGNRSTSKRFFNKMSVRLRLRHSVALAAGAMLMPFASSAHADNMQVWTGSVNSEWSVAGNWSPAITPVVGDTVTFGSNVTAPITDASNVNLFVSEINFTNTNATNIWGTTANSQTIIMGPGASSEGINVASNAGPVTFSNVNAGTSSQNLGFQVSGAATFLNNSTNTLTLGGVETISSGVASSGTVTIDGSGNTEIIGFLGNQTQTAGTTLGLIKNGSGTLLLDNNPSTGVKPSWTGGFTINAGVVGVAGGNTFSGSQNQANTIYLNGGVLYLNATSSKTAPKSDPVIFGGNFAFGIASG